MWGLGGWSHVLNSQPSSMWTSTYIANMSSLVEDPAPGEAGTQLPGRPGPSSRGDWDPMLDSAVTIDNWNFIVHLIGPYGILRLHSRHLAGSEIRVRGVIPCPEFTTYRMRRFEDKWSFCAGSYMSYHLSFITCPTYHLSPVSRHFSFSTLFSEKYA